MYTRAHTAHHVHRGDAYGNDDGDGRYWKSSRCSSDSPEIMLLFWLLSSFGSSSTSDTWLSSMSTVSSVAGLWDADSYREDEIAISSCDTARLACRPAGRTWPVHSW